MSGAPALPVLVVVPTYNEALNVPSLVERVGPVVGGGSFDVLFVDDNSPDGTGDLIADLAATRPWLHLLRRDRPSGLGSAYRAGFGWGLGRDYLLIGEMDADLSHDPDVLPRLVDALVAGEADLAIGSRYVDGGGADGWPLRRRLLSRAANSFARSLLRLSVQDVTAGFRVYRRDAIRLILDEGTRCDGYGFQVEGTVLVARAGGRIAEVPIRFVDRRYGTSKMSGAIMLEAAKRCFALAFTMRAVPALPGRNISRIPVAARAERTA